jgi:hypothetical protein
VITSTKIKTAASARGTHVNKAFDINNFEANWD